MKEGKQKRKEGKEKTDEMVETTSETVYLAQVETPKFHSNGHTESIGKPIHQSKPVIKIRSTILFNKIQKQFKLITTIFTYGNICSKDEILIRGMAIQGFNAESNLT